MRTSLKDEIMYRLDRYKYGIDKITTEQVTEDIIELFDKRTSKLSRDYEAKVKDSKYRIGYFTAIYDLKEILEGDGHNNNNS